MGIRITGSGMLESNIAKAQKDYDNSIERLSSGVKFTRSEPMPVERAQSDALMAKMRELNNYKKNINEGLSLTETAESSLSELTNSTIRLKELVAQATNPNLSDKERQFLFVEYQAHYEEMDRIASTTAYGGHALLNNSSDGVSVSLGRIDSEENQSSAKTIGFRVGPPAIADGKDLSVVTLEGMDTIKARPHDLGLKSAERLANSDEGVSLDDVLDNFDVSNESELGASFDNAQLQLSSYRANFGAATSRLSSAMNSTNVAYENIAAANSRLRDVDYATEMTNLAKANILVQAGTSLLAQRNNTATQTVLSLVKSINKE